MATSTPTQSTRVLILSRNRLLGEGIRQLLEKSPFTSIICKDISHLTAELSRSHQNSIILANVESTDEADTELEKWPEIKVTFPQVKFVALADDAKFEDILEIFKFEADGCLVSDIGAEVLIHSLILVLNGTKVLSGNFVGGLLDQQLSLQSREERPNPASDAILTEAEKRLLEQLVRGLPNKSISRTLGIAEGTVKMQIKGLFRKIGVENRTQAAVWAVTRRIDKKAPQYPKKYSGQGNGVEGGKYHPQS